MNDICEESCKQANILKTKTISKYMRVDVKVKRITDFVLVKKMSKDVMDVKSVRGLERGISDYVAL